MANSRSVYLYFLRRPDDWDYDQPDAAVVAAYDEASARSLSGVAGATEENVIVKVIGLAMPESGLSDGDLVVRSFNAG